MATLAGSASTSAFGPQASTSASASIKRTTQMPSFDQEDDTVTVVWHGEKYRIPLPPPEAPLSTLRALIEERTGVAPEYQKLIMNGGVMQKDLPLKVYGLVKPSDSDDQYDPEKTPSSGFRTLLNKWGLGNSPASGKKIRELKITLVGNPKTAAVVSDRLPGSSGSEPDAAKASSASAAGKRPAAEANSNSAMDEPRVAAQIDSLINNTLNKLRPDLQGLFSLPIEQARQEKQKHLYLSEMLLQTLLKLDGFEVDRRWTEARRVRKEGIKKVQGILDRVDAIKEGRELDLSEDAA